MNFADFKGRVLLVTNTASFCGYTYQYEALEKLHTARSAAGLTVIGVPSQDFNQESADNATVKTFCETRFDIDFPLTAISHVRGAQAAPFYAWVKSRSSGSRVELQQGPDRPGRPHRRHFRIRRRAQRTRFVPGDRGRTCQDGPRMNWRQSGTPWRSA